MIKKVCFFSLIICVGLYAVYIHFLKKSNRVLNESFCYIILQSVTEYYKYNEKWPCNNLSVKSENLYFFTDLSFYEIINKFVPGKSEKWNIGVKDYQAEILFKKVGESLNYVSDVHGRMYLVSLDKSKNVIEVRSSGVDGIYFSNDDFYHQQHIESSK